MNRNVLFALTMLLALGLLPTSGAQDTAPAASEKKSAVKAELNAEALKVLMDAKVPMAILDARGPSNLWIPGAVPLTPDADEKAIRQALPNRDALIVTYCGGPECPMSLKLAERLTALGYTHVIRFTGGMEAWGKAGLPLKAKDAAPGSGTKAPAPTPMPPSGSGARPSGSGSR